MWDANDNCCEKPCSQASIFYRNYIFDYAIATKNSHCKKASFTKLLYHFIEFFVMSFLLN